MKIVKDNGLTFYQSQYFAWQLTRQAAGDSVDSLGPTLVDAQVDLNPHQCKAPKCLDTVLHKIHAASGRIAAKVINQLGDEVMKAIKV